MESNAAILSHENIEHVISREYLGADNFVWNNGGQLQFDYDKKRGTVSIEHHKTALDILSERIRHLEGSVDALHGVIQGVMVNAIKGR